MCQLLGRLLIAELRDLNQHEEIDWSIDAFYFVPSPLNRYFLVPGFNNLKLITVKLLCNSS